MPYDVKCWELAEAFGHDMLTDNEIAKLSQHIQDEVESEIEYLLIVRKESHGITHDPR
jgi:hypothetical protein